MTASEIIRTREERLRAALAKGEYDFRMGFRFIKSEHFSKL